MIFILWFLNIFLGGMGVSLLATLLMGTDISETLPEEIKNKLGFMAVIFLVISLALFILAIKMTGGGL